jgi:hypothetical protein
VRTVRLIGPPLWRVRLLRRDSVRHRPACAGGGAVDHAEGRLMKPQSVQNGSVRPADPRIGPPEAGRAAFQGLGLARHPRDKHEYREGVPASKVRQNALEFSTAEICRTPRLTPLAINTI